MTDKEKTEEDKFRQTLQDACSFSDEQLLRDLEKAEKALGEFEFSGAEERIFKKLMEREAINTERMREEGKEGEEKAAEKVLGKAVEKELKTVPEVTLQTVPEVATEKIPEKALEEVMERVPEAALQTISEENADKALGGVSEKILEAATERVSEKATEAASERVPEVTSQKEPEAATAKASEKGKVIRFGRRKRMLMVALVAAFVGMLGAKAVGGNSYVFQFNPKSAGFILDNGRNHTDIGDLNEAYEIASQKLNIKILRLGYIPKHMKFTELNINENKAVFVFRYEKVKVHVFQIQRPKETSFNSSSDNEKKDIIVHNKWIDQDAYIREEVIDSQKGYSALITTGDGLYRITGEISEDEIKKIVENLNFY
ncbi:MAG: DUF4367 domain-containing protein [bacterium]|nr:DUF4367 domain-containing protein [bacterium]